jgi:hypothetical protein
MNILENVKKLLKKRLELHRQLVSIDNLLEPLGQIPIAGRPVRRIKQARAIRRKMSAAARAKLAASAKARWKKAKAEGKVTL